MDAEYLVIDDHAQGEEVKHVREVMPDVGITVFPRTFCVKTVGLSNAARLVVAANEMNAMGVS